MKLNKEAQELNEIFQESPEVYEMLSDFGKRIYFLESGVLAQSWEAREKAFRFNATLGEAQSNRETIYSRTFHDAFLGFAPNEVYPYAPPAGLKELRQLWLEKMLRENPLFEYINISLPVVTTGVTHGLSLAADLFLNPGDRVVVHDKHWENYELIFEVRNSAIIETYPMFVNNSFNVSGLENCINACQSDKVFVILNFPNNPTGYTPAMKEAEEIAAALVRCAEAGKKIVALCDDTYYGLWYNDEVIHESIFGLIAGSHPSILAIRLDGATKEHFAGGFRVGFITFGGKSGEVLTALEKKAIGTIRASISSSSRTSQAILFKILSDSKYTQELMEGRQLLCERGKEVMELIKKGSSKNLWNAYPFNSGYFVCIKVSKNARRVRDYLLSQYGIGVIAISDEDIRISVPCIEINEIRELFSILDEAIESA
ncbi:MAG TPA: aminotransferase class I/II-fold pyridoxal phosphate-dependent enzyme [Clostridiaceae bacterium]|nr:aminotransferase class I/II-fold pyridoxal phosphate-dependent enzyme [Clostridiaceae bacterium]